MAHSDRPKRSASAQMGRKPAPPKSAEQPEPTEPPVDPVAAAAKAQLHLRLAIGGLLVLAIGLGVAAGISRTPSNGFAVAVGVVVIGLIFGSMLRPPPLKDNPGESAAIDFGRQEDQPRAASKPARPNRAERRRAAREDRKK
jgi:hypothetical protein